MRSFAMMPAMALLSGCLYYANGNGVHHQLVATCEESMMRFVVNSREACTFMRVERNEIIGKGGPAAERVIDLASVSLQFSDPSAVQVLSIEGPGDRIDAVLRMRKTGRVRMSVIARTPRGRTYRDEFWITAALPHAIELVCDPHVERWTVGRRARCSISAEGQLAGSYVEGVQVTGGLHLSTDAQSLHDDWFVVEAISAGPARLSIPGGLDLTMDVAPAHP